MIAILAGLVPVFAVIFLGYALRRRQLIPDAFWPAAERMTFMVFFPALLVVNTAQARLGPGLGAITAAVAGSIVIVSLACIPLRRPLRLDGPAFTSLIQSAIRPNVYVALAAAAATFGGEGVALISLCVAVGVPVVNIISVVALQRWGSGGGGGVTLARALVSHPLILACAIGLAVNAAGLGLPPLIGPLLQILGAASLPLGLLAVGAGLDPKALRSSGAGVVAAGLLKLAMLPAVTLAIAVALGAGGREAAVATLYGALPVSASAYVMARQMGGDGPFLAASITLTTLAAAITLPLVLFMLDLAGFLAPPLAAAGGGTL
jgi:malonate transporter